MIPLSDKRPESVMAAMEAIHKDHSEHFSEVFQIELWCNNLPRKILGYRTPDDIFEEELDRIYHVSA